MNRVGLIKKVLEPLLPILVGFNAAANGAPLTANMCMWGLAEFTMNGTNDPNRDITSLVFNKRIVVFLAMGFPCFRDEGIPRVGKRTTDLLIGAPRAAFSR